VQRQALVFSGPGQVEIVDEPCPRPGPGELLVATRLCAVSAGTELLAYRGQLPEDLPLDETLPALADASTKFPFRYGYASMGVVAEVGAGVDAGWRGRRVFAFVPHASAFVASAAELFVVPDEVPDDLAPLLASAETAVNLVLDARPLLGERVLVVGQGVVGLLVTAQLGRFPLAALVALESNPARDRLAAQLGADVTACTDVAAARAALGSAGADLAFEISGNPAALDTAIALTGREGRVVVGSFYGKKSAPVALGGHFHRARLTLISSQVSHIAPGLAGRWDRRRRMAAAWRLLAAVARTPGLAKALISHRLPFAEAAAGYQLLASGDPTALQLLFVHS
jgi:2-desacetyl-2-hydroxyethyl bacteriochlorophyllide A dehydrogenase